MSSSTPAVVAQSATDAKFRSKVTVGLLAALLGWAGAHWWYLGRRRAWLVTAYAAVMVFFSSRAMIWWENPAFFLLYIPAIDGLIEAVVLCLMSDARFDARYNPGLVRATPSGWGPVLVAAFTLLIGAVALMFGLAMIVIYVWTQLGWLDGFDLNSD